MPQTTNWWAVDHNFSMSSNRDIQKQDLISVVTRGKNEASEVRPKSYHYKLVEKNQLALSASGSRL